MVAARHIGTDERRARLGIRHRLAPGTQASSVADAAASVVALHATDSASVFLQARARMVESSPEEIDRELYVEGSALRLLSCHPTRLRQCATRGACVLGDHRTTPRRYTRTLRGVKD